MKRQIRLGPPSRDLRDGLTIGFCLATVAYQLLMLVAPVRLMFYTLHLTSISSVLAMGGVALFCLDLLTDREFLKLRQAWPLMAALGVMGLSSLVWWDSGIVSNAKVIMWQLAQMLVIFPASRRLTSAQWKKLLYWLYLGVCAVYVPTILGSMWQFFTLYSTKVDIGGNLTRLGFQEGRLFGLFSGIYFSTVAVGLLMVASIYYAWVDRRKLQRWMFSGFGVLCGLYVVLSGTRSVLVGCMISFGLCAFLLGTHAFRQRSWHPVKRRGLAAVLALAVALGIFLGAEGTGVALKEAAVALNSGSITPGTEPTSPQDPSDPSQVEDPTLPDMDRADVNLENISNSRFRIWKDYLSVGFDSIRSTLLGYSPGGYMVAIRDSNPDLFIVRTIRDKYPHMYERNLIYDAHNGYLLVFVNTGLLGVLFIAVFLSMCVCQVLVRLYTQRRFQPEQYALLAMVVLMLVSVFFDSDLFYKCTSTSVIFWLLAGLLLRSTTASRETA